MRLWFRTLGILLLVTTVALPTAPAAYADDGTGGGTPASDTEAQARLLDPPPRQTPSRPGREHIVQPGEYLSRIAARYGVSVAALVGANVIPDPDLIFPGQRLVIPQTAAAAPALSVPTPTVAPRQRAQPPTYDDGVRALYVTYFAIGHAGLRQHALELIDETELNAIVIDVKGDRGFLVYESAIPMVAETGAQPPAMIHDPASFLAELDARGVYKIARIVVFKDNPLATARPDLAIRDSRTGGLWIDREGLAWVDPFREEVWNYNASLAREAALLGFDEIQFDYVRFPTDGVISAAVYSQPNTYENRLEAITGFLARARAALEGTGAKLAADVFGYTTWRDDDMGIGQRLENLAPYLDVLSPMLYPSTFGSGIPGITVSVAHPYNIVYESTTNALRRLEGKGVVVRPWLQDFPDYRFDGRDFGVQEVRAQIQGASDAGASGWMLWDPRVRYTAAALEPEG